MKKLGSNLSEAKFGIQNVSILDGDQFVEDARIIIDDGKILTIIESDADEITEFGINWFDGEGMWVIPGFFNSHTHVAMSVLREKAHGQSNMIEDVFFPFESSLTEDDVYNNSLPSLIAGIKSGVTTFVDHYYFINGVARAIERLGVRGFVAETLADLGGAKPNRIPPDKFVDAKKWEWDHKKLVHHILGPHAADTVSEYYMREIAEFADEYEIPVHMHLSQTQSERDAVFGKESLSPVQWAENCGLLTPKTLAVHLVTANKDDASILRKNQVHVGLCPTSQIFFEELAPLELFKEYELTGLLGTDCAASHDSMDIMQELRFLHLMYKKLGIEFSAKDVLKTVWKNPAQWLGTKTGQISPGYVADLVFLKRGPECDPVSDPHLHLLLTLSSRHVQHSMVAGRFVLWNQTLIA